MTRTCSPKAICSRSSLAGPRAFGFARISMLCLERPSFQGTIRRTHRTHAFVQNRVQLFIRSVLRALRHVVHLPLELLGELIALDPLRRFMGAESHDTDLFSRLQRSAQKRFQCGSHSGGQILRFLNGYVRHNIQPSWCFSIYSPKYGLVTHRWRPGVVSKSIC